MPISRMTFQHLSWQKNGPLHCIHLESQLPMYSAKHLLLRILSMQSLRAAVGPEHAHELRSVQMHFLESAIRTPGEDPTPVRTWSEALQIAIYFVQRSFANSNWFCSQLQLIGLAMLPNLKLRQTQQSMDSFPLLQNYNFIIASMNANLPCLHVHLSWNLQRPSGCHLGSLHWRYWCSKWNGQAACYFKGLLHLAHVHAGVHICMHGQCKVWGPFCTQYSGLREWPVLTWPKAFFRRWHDCDYKS